MLNWQPFGPRISDRICKKELEQVQKNICSSFNWNVCVCANITSCAVLQSFFNITVIIFWYITYLSIRLTPQAGLIAKKCVNKWKWAIVWWPTFRKCIFQHTMYLHNVDCRMCYSNLYIFLSSIEKYLKLLPVLFKIAFSQNSHNIPQINISIFVSGEKEISDGKETSKFNGHSQ